MRELEVECRAIARRALDPHAAAVRLCDTARDGQTDTGAQVRRALHLPEAIEHVRDVFRLDTWAAIADREAHAAAFRGLGGHLNASAIGRELDRVIEIVRQQLEDAITIRR